MGDSIRDELRSLIQEVQVQNKAPVILVESRLEAQLQNLSHQLQELFGSLSASKGKDPKVGTSSNNQPNPNQEMCHRMDTCTDTRHDLLEGWCKDMLNWIFQGSVEQRSTRLYRCDNFV